MAVVAVVAPTAKHTNCNRQWTVRRRARATLARALSYLNKMPHLGRDLRRCIIDLAMQTPLQRLYKTKFVLVAVIATVAGVVMLLAVGWPSWQSSVSLVGGALATAGLIGVWFQFIGNADVTEQNKREFAQVIRDEAPAIRDSVVEAMAFTPEKLLDVTAPAVVDRVIENGLAKQLGNRELATDIYANLKQQVERAPTTLHDLRIAIALTPWKGGPQSGAGSMFVATVTWEYRAANTRRAVRFACVSDPEEYRELLHDPATDAVWYFQPIAGLDGGSPEAFELVQFTVNGEARRPRRSARKGGQSYFIALPEDTADAGEKVAVSYTYRTLVQRNGHTLHLNFSEPTKGLTVSCAYGGVGIRFINVYSFISATKDPVVTRRPAHDPSPVVSLTCDGWVMPQDGLVFVWVLDGEMNAGADSR